MQTNSQIDGRWEAEGMPAGPWIFELTVVGSTVTGRVMQHGGIPGPSPIYQGKVDGGTIVFKSKNPVVSNVTKEVTFTGVLSGNVIAFERSVEIVLNGTNDGTLPQESGLFGSLGPTKFAAKRAGPVPKPPAPVERTGGAPVDATGKWESLRWNMDRWVLDLKSSGAQLSGTVSIVAAPGKQVPGNNVPLPIYDAKVDGNTVVFKCKSPDNLRTISFTGIIQVDEMSVVRVIEVPAGAATGFEAPFGAFAPMTFLSRRSPRSAQPENKTVRELQQAQKMWADANVKDYEYSMEWRCLCTFPYQPLSYRVTRGVGAFVQNPALTALLSLPAQGVKGMTERYDTIDQLFEYLNAAAAQQPFALKIEYDQKLGYPMSVDFDPGGSSVDDDVHIRISGFRVVN
jgi:hypothetical protein